jgi:hypothetical protein
MSAPGTRDVRTGYERRDLCGSSITDAVQSFERQISHAFDRRVGDVPKPLRAALI